MYVLRRTEQKNDRKHFKISAPLSSCEGGNSGKIKTSGKIQNIF